VFTFGRDHEKACAIQYVTDPAQHELVERLVDLVHDVLEGRAQLESLAGSLKHALREGGAGVWEQAGVWLRKMAAEYPELLHVWRDLASDRSASVRFRIAAHLSDMPTALASELGARLLADRSGKVREKAASDLGDVRDPDVFRLLQQTLEVEKEQRVIDSLNWAIDQQRSKNGESGVGGA
jgi:HEAT repeat protein